MPFYGILSTFGNRALHNHTTKICTLCRCVYFQLSTPLTSSLRTPKILVKEFCYFLMPCHKHGLCIDILVQR